jgi:hypothetical protein
MTGSPSKKFSGLLLRFEIQCDTLQELERCIHAQRECFRLIRRIFRIAGDASQFVLLLLIQLNHGGDAQY